MYRNVNKYTSRENKRRKTDKRVWESFWGWVGSELLMGWPWNDEKFWINHICDMWSIKLRKFIILKQNIPIQYWRAMSQNLRPVKEVLAHK